MGTYFGTVQRSVREKLWPEDTCLFCSVQEGNNQRSKNKDRELTSAGKEVGCINMLCLHIVNSDLRRRCECVNCIKYYFTGLEMFYETSISGDSF